MSGYNEGDQYEQIIFDILKNRGFLSPNATRAGAGSGTDIKFLYKSNEYNLEVKLDLKADFGQKMLRWKDGIWFWNVKDKITDFYTSIGVLKSINAQNIIPYRYSLSKNDITVEYKTIDRRAFENSISISVSALHSYYNEKNCFYIQVGGYGFYHLGKDILELGTPLFDCGMKLRLRGKTITSEPVYNYGFYAVLKIDSRSRPKKSQYDIEEKEHRTFPPLEH